MASVLGTADFSALANHFTMGWFPLQEPPELAPERNGGGMLFVLRMSVLTGRKKVFIWGQGRDVGPRMSVPCLAFTAMLVVT